MFERMMVMAVGLMIGAATLVTWPGEGAAQLTSDDAKALSKCQDAVAKGGQKFVKTKLKLVEQCGTERVEAGLKCAALDPKCANLVVKAEELCAKNFEKVLPASTKFVDDVIKACEPVNDLIFGIDDPLLYQSLVLFIGDLIGEPITVTNVTELAGALCATKELLVDIAAILEVPAGLLLQFDLFTIPLDPRCNVLVGTI